MILKRLTWASWVVLIVLALSGVYGAQQQISGGGATTLNAGSAIVGKVGIDQTTPGTTNLVQVGGSLPAGSAVIGHVINDTGSTTAVTGNVTVVQPTGTSLHAVLDTTSTTAVTQATAANLNATVVGTGTFATQSTLAGGTANVGFFRMLPSSCTQNTTFTNSTVGVATGAGTSVTSTTTCITQAFANNITNSAVTLRIQDKTGTPIIWVGGAADFTVPANSNVQFPLAGVTMTAGITAIAGTGSAINLQIAGVQ